MRKKIVIASHNEGKISEFNYIFKILGLDYDLLSLNDIGFNSPIDETGNSYLENATLKLNAVSDFTTYPILSDDSGLDVPDMENILGIYSARFGGENATDIDNLDKLKTLLESQNINDVEAHYTCCLVFKVPNRPVQTCEAKWHGTLKPEPRGKNGFGYDPLFYLPDNRTSAELSDIEKNRISHRALAIKKLAPFVRKYV